jgi:hypothetical protein
MKINIESKKELIILCILLALFGLCFSIGQDLYHLIKGIF